MNLNYHPAPGLGDLLPGFYVVPQNPLKQAVTVAPGIGDLVTGSGIVNFSVPQNPLKSYVSGNVRPLGTGMGCCGCSGQLNGVGMGDLTSDWGTISADMTAGNYTKILTDTVFGFPVWGVLAAAVVLPMVLGGSGGGRRRR